MKELQILPTQLDTEQILKSIGCSMLDVGTEMIMKHEQHLSSSYNSSSSGFGFLEGICLTGEVTSNDVRECRKQLCIKSRKRRNLPERFKKSDLLSKNH